MPNNLLFCSAHRTAGCFLGQTLSLDQKHFPQVDTEIRQIELIIRREILRETSKKRGIVHALFSVKVFDYESKHI